MFITLVSLFIEDEPVQIIGFDGNLFCFQAGGALYIPGGRAIKALRFLEKSCSVPQIKGPFIYSQEGQLLLWGPIYKPPFGPQGFF